MKFFIKVDTDYCGTEDYFIVEAKDEREAAHLADDLAYNNAMSYYDIVTDEDMMLAEENEEDTSGMLTTEQYYASIEEYNPEEHDMYGPSAY